MYRFSEYIAQRGYSHEEPILSQLPRMDFVQQATVDKQLHQDVITKGSFGSQSGVLGNDIDWKQQFIDIVQGRTKDPEIIRQTIDIVRRDMDSHMNRPPNIKTGSAAWHRAWVEVYRQWLNKLEQILGAVNDPQQADNRTQRGL